MDLRLVITYNCCYNGHIIMDILPSTFPLPLSPLPFLIQGVEEEEAM